MNLKFFTVIFLLVSSVRSFDFEKCFKTDSISCLQLEAFRIAKFLMNRRSITIGGFLNVTTNQDERMGKSVKLSEIQVLQADGVMQRQSALEDYFQTQVKAWWKGTSVSWSSDGMIRALPDFLPEDLQTETLVEEGRAKDKKQSGMLVPLLIGIKLKMAAIGALAYMLIAVVAKKAAIAGVISLLVSGFVAIKKFTDTPKQNSGPYYVGWRQSQAGPWNNPSSSWHGTAGVEREADSIVGESHSPVFKSDRVYKV